MANSIGTAWIQIKPSLSGISSDITKELNGSSASASANFGNNFKSNFLSNAKASFSEAFTEFGKRSDTAWANFKSAAKVGLTAATTGIIGAATYAVKQFADYEQLIGGVETLFKDNAGIVQGFAKDAYKNAQMSANQYMETITGFSASLLQGLKGDTKEAAKIGNMAVIDMADNANKMGTSMESIQFAYQGFAKQNYTMLDNLKLGYGGTKTEMQRLLKDAEKMPQAMGQKFNLDNYADVIKAIHVVQENMGVTGTSAKEASTTISGSLATAKAAFADMMTALADPDGDFSGAFDTFLAAAKQFLKNLAPVISNIGKTIFDEIKRQSPELAKILTDIGNGIKSVFDFVKNNQDLVLTILKFVAGFKALQIATGGVRSVMNTLSPYGKILKGVFQVAAGGVQSLIGKLSKTKEAAGAMDKLSKSSQNLVAKTPKTFTFGDSIANFLKNIGKTLSGAVDAVLSPIKTFLKGMGDALAGFFKAFANPAILMGALGFAAAAAAIAAAILLIGGAIGLVTPGLAAFMNDVILPLGAFLRDTLITVIETVTQAIIDLTNGAVIPLGTFLAVAFIATLNTVTDAIIRLTQQAIIPLINTVGGIFLQIMQKAKEIIQAVGDVINNTLKTAFDGIKGVISAVGDAFTKMGNAIKTALDGVSGVIKAFKDIIVAIGNAIIAVVALATGRSVKYGTGFATVTSGKAYGGFIEGRGGARSDNQLTPTSPGEFVTQKWAAQSIGAANMNYMNRTGELPPQAEPNTQNNSIVTNVTISGYNQDPNTLANKISQIIALKQKGVMA